MLCDCVQVMFDQRRLRSGSKRKERKKRKKKKEEEGKEKKKTDRNLSPEPKASDLMLPGMFRSSISKRISGI